jgi:uncharacterized protein involved in type VI secretion and phage assembly
MMEPNVLHLVLDLLRSRCYGKYRGTVDSNEDETKRGRLKVLVKGIVDEPIWAMPCVPYAGKNVGLLALPEPGTGVWVEFEGGDPSFPIWTGCFWADGEAPEKANPKIKIWKTAKTTLRLDDDKDRILTETSGKARVELGDDVVSEAGKSKHTVGSSGVVSEQGKGKVEVTTGSVKVNNGAMEVV